MALSVFGIGNLASNALFVDSEVIMDNAFTTGRVDLSTSDTWAVFEAPAMMPGDVEVAPLTMSNDGTTRLRYSLTSSLTPPAEVGADAADDPALREGLADQEALAAQLDLSVAIAKNPADCTASNFENLTQVLYGPEDFSAYYDLPIFGDRAAGEQGGERVLDAGRSEVLCMKVSLPLETPNEFAGLTAAAYLTAHAEQTKNNS